EDRKLNIGDIVASFESACKKNSSGIASPAYDLVFSEVKGAEEFMSGQSKSISGITHKDQVLTIELIQQDANFLYKLANVNASIQCKKILDEGLEGEVVVGTGPFKYGSYVGSETSQLILLKNEDYYETDSEGNALPYL